MRIIGAQMTVTLNLDKQSEALLEARAKAEGLDTHAYLERVVRFAIAEPIDPGEPDYLDDREIPILRPAGRIQIPLSVKHAGPIRFPAIDQDAMLVDEI